MERKFASKLSQLKPAAEARKQASSQLKENILSVSWESPNFFFLQNFTYFPLTKHKLKFIDPIDYDSYIDENLAHIRKDNCSRQLILLPDDDIIYEQELPDEKPNQLSTSKLPPNLSLLVSDCLRAYLKRVYRVEFKYAAYGQNYYDLPGYRESVLAFNRLVDEKRFGICS